MNTEVSRITSIVSHAFRDDPTWSPVVSPNGVVSDATYRYWELFVRSAARYPWTFLSAEGAAASVWIPPEGSELTPDEAIGFEDFATELFGAARTSTLLRIVEQFDAATPPGAYAYLSLLAVDPAHAGTGAGMQLLAENLIHTDALGVPTYLESSNPINNAKYERLGYRAHGTIPLPSGLALTTYWRDPSPSE